MPPPPRAIVVHAAAWEDVGRIGVYGLSGCLAGERVDSPVRPDIARSRLWAAAAYAARCSAPPPLLCEGAPLSREAVVQQDVRAGSPTPGAASLSARQEATEVEAPVYLAPCQAQQGAQEDRVLPQVAAVQVCDGLEGVDAAFRAGRRVAR